MSLILQQTGTASDLAFPTISGVTNATDAKHRVMQASGTAGAGETYTIAAGATNAFLAWTVPANALPYTAWAAGTYAIGVNVTTRNTSLTLSRVIIRRVSSTGALLATVADVSGLTQSLGTVGTYTLNISGAAQTANTTDRLQVVLLATNSNTMSGQACGIASSQTVATPIAPPAFTLGKYRLYADGTESGSTALAAEDTSASVAPGVKVQARAMVQETGGGAGPQGYGWQYGSTQSNINILAPVGSGTSGLALNDGLRVGAAYTPEGAITISSITASLRRIGAAVGTVVAEIRSSLGGPVIATSTNSFDASAMSTAFAGYTFTFSPAVVPAEGRVYVNLAGVTSVFPDRIGLEDATPVSNDQRIYQVSGGGWAEDASNSSAITITGSATTWNAIPAPGTANVPVRYTDSTNLTHGGATTARVTGTGTFAAGRVYEQADTTTITVAANGYTNLLASVELVSGQVANNDTIQFRVVRADGTPLNAYTVTPAITANVAGGPTPQTAGSSGAAGVAGGSTTSVRYGVSDASAQGIAGGSTAAVQYATGGAGSAGLAGSSAANTSTPPQTASSAGSAGLGGSSHATVRYGAATAHSLGAAGSSNRTFSHERSTAAGMGASGATASGMAYSATTAGAGGLAGQSTTGIAQSAGSAGAAGVSGSSARAFSYDRSDAGAQGAAGSTSATAAYGAASNEAFGLGGQSGAGIRYSVSSSGALGASGQSGATTSTPPQAASTSGTAGIGGASAAVVVYSRSTAGAAGHAASTDRTLALSRTTSGALGAAGSSQRVRAFNASSNGALGSGASSTARAHYSTGTSGSLGSGSSGSVQVRYTIGTQGAAGLSGQSGADSLQKQEATSGALGIAGSSAAQQAFGRTSTGATGAAGSSTAMIFRWNEPGTTPETWGSQPAPSGEWSSPVSPSGNWTPVNGPSGAWTPDATAAGAWMPV